MRALREIRRRRGLSLRKLADASGVHYQTIFKYECGKAEPGARNIVKLARALECSTDELLKERKGEKDA